MRVFGAFKEAMKKLAVAGIVSAGFIALVAFLGIVVEIPDLGIVISYIIPYITVPALIICAFGFLFKRKSCDVFCALPVKRSTLYFVNMLSVIFWTLLSYLLPLVIMGLNSGFNYVFSEYGGIYLGHIATCLYIMGGTTVAIFLTGRIFTAIINSIIIAIMPRFIYLVVCNAIFNKINYLVSDAPGMPDLSGESYLTMGFIEGERVGYIICGLILLGIGFVLFNKRKSETAEQSAPNRALKITYSSLLSFGISLIPISHYINRYGFVSVNNSTALLFYCVSILVPFLYELVTTKRINFKYGLFSLLVVIGLNALTYLAFFGSCQYFENQKIDIKGYRLINYFNKQSEALDREYKYLYIWGDYRDDNYAYNQLLVNDYFITTPAYVEEVNKQYQKMQEYNGKFNTTENPYVFALIDSKGREYYRCLYLNSYEVKQLWYYATTSDSGFLERTATMPAPEHIESALCFNDASFDKELYEVFYKEMMALTKEERISLTYTVDTNCNIYLLKNKDDISRSITVEGRKYGKKYRSIYNIHAELCPETFRMVKERLFEENRKEIERLLKNTENNFENFTVELQVMPEKGKYNHKEIVPYKIKAEKSVGYKISKTNENVVWYINSDEIARNHNYTEYDIKKVQWFFDSILNNLTVYDGNKEYNAKVIVSYNYENINKTNAFSYEFDMTYEEFKMLYNMLTYKKEA